MKTERLFVKELPSYEFMRKARVGQFSIHEFDKRITYCDAEYVVEDETGKRDLITSHVANLIQQMRLPKGDRGALSAPLFARPCRLYEAYYVDIKSAYRQIASVWGAETLWLNNVPVAIGETKFDSPLFDYKLARGLIVSLTSEYRTESIWQDKQMVTNRIRNHKYAPSLQCAIFTTLHAIMQKCRPFVYCNTDGIIVQRSGLERVCDTLDSYNLRYGIKEQGSAIVWGVGSYSFNGRKTLRKAFGEYDNISTDNHEQAMAVYKAFSIAR